MSVDPEGLSSNIKGWVDEPRCHSADLLEGKLTLPSPIRKRKELEKN